MLAVEATAKRRPGRPRMPTRREPILSVKGVPEFKAWLDEFSGFIGLSLADTVGMALQNFAEAKGFQAPPKR